MKQIYIFVSKAGIRIVAVVLVLLLGLQVKNFLAAMHRPPSQKEHAKTVLKVAVREVYPEDVPVVLKELGEARTLDVVTVAAEVPGRVVAVHPRLEVGETIPAGEVLFKIDPRDYDTALAEAEAQVAMLASGIERLETEYGVDRKRLVTIRRNRELAKLEYDRMKSLEKDKVGTRSGADQAEMAFNQANDAWDQLERAVSLYPIRIRESRSSLAGAEAARDRAQANCDRCSVRAEFDARVKAVQVEAGQYAQPGAALVTLANDALLEISVPLPSGFARSWLRFCDADPDRDNAWFPEVEPVRCRVRWTEDPENHYWDGTLHRVERFVRETLTLIVVVRVTGEEALAGKGGLPLVDGMFCSVEIPGKTMKQVYRLPPWAVSYEGDVYVSEDLKLKRRKVTVLREQGGEAFISEGLDAGDQVIVTRLVNPLPNTDLDHEEDEGAGSAS